MGSALSALCDRHDEHPRHARAEPHLHARHQRRVIKIWRLLARDRVYLQPGEAVAASTNGISTFEQAESAQSANGMRTSARVRRARGRGCLRR